MPWQDHEIMTVFLLFDHLTFFIFSFTHVVQMIARASAITSVFQEDRLKKSGNEVQCLFLLWLCPICSSRRSRLLTLDRIYLQDSADYTADLEMCGAFWLGGGGRQGKIKLSFSIIIPKQKNGYLKVMP